MLKNKLNSEQQSYAFLELKKRDPQYSKSNDSCVKYADKNMLSNALNNITDFSINPNELENKIGSNLPELIKLLKELSDK